MKNIFKEIRDKMAYIEGQNNYADNTLWVHIYSDGIVVESGCINEYGSDWGNDDTQFISWVDLPNWVGRKLLPLDCDCITISE